MFIRNAWYMAGWAHDIGREALVARTLLGEPVVMYRLQNGDPVALQDRCPHRLVPLRVGKLKGDVLECGYHGLQFAASGGCVFNPHGDGKISGNMQVKSYPVAERDGIVWIWMGDPALADTAKIKPFAFITDRQRYTAIFGHMNVGANYQLVNDNLLDLSHTQFVHPLFQGPVEDGPPPRTDAEFGQDGDTLWGRTMTYDVPPIPFAAMFTDLARVDTFVDTYWHAPSVIHLDIGTQPVGVSRGPETNETPSVHLLTPETETSTHYFWTMARNRKLEDTQLSQAVWSATDHAFSVEDKPLIEMQQAELGDADLMDRRPVLLQTDSAAVRARRIIKGMLEAEQAPARIPEPAE